MTVSLERDRSTPERTSLAQWTAVGALTAATFTVVTAEMLPVGVLTPMAAGLGTSLGAAGTSLTVTGLVSAVAAPIVPRLLGEANRRTVLAAAMFVLALGNALTALAGGFGALVVSRIVLGIGMGVVWGLAAAVAPRLVAERDAARAVSWVLGGVAGASVIGMPLGTFVAHALGWRTAFAALGGISLLLGIVLAAALPTLRRPKPRVGAGRSRARGSLARPEVAIGLAVVALAVTAHFAAFTYVRPVLEERVQLSARAIAPLLVLYGVCGLLGNFAAGAAAARRPRGTVLVLTAGIAVAIALLAVFGSGAIVAGSALALWGAAYGGLSVGGQLWMTRAAPDRVEHVTGLYVGVFTGAIALGAALGGVLVEHSGLTLTLWAAVILAGVALGVGTVGGRCWRVGAHRAQMHDFNT